MEEADLVTTIVHFFRSQPSASVRVMIDVGAQNGGMSWPFVELGWQVCCFEPEPSNHSDLIKRMSSSPNAHCFQMAVSNQDAKEIPFFVSDRHPGIHSLQPFHPTHRPAVKTSTTRLDTFLRAQRIGRVDFLKVDAEGADYLVLQGMDWEAFRPAIVMAEFMDSRTVPNYGYSFHDMVRYVMGYGYDCLVFEYGPIVEYGKKEGSAAPLPEFLGVYPYRPGSDPVWGNVLFCLTDEHRRFEKALIRTQRTIRLRTVGRRFLPRPLRAALRPLTRRLLP